MKLGDLKRRLLNGTWMDTPALKERIRKSSIRMRRKVKRFARHPHPPVKRSYPVRKFKFTVPINDTGYVMEYSLNFERIMELSKNRFDLHSDPKIECKVTKATDLRDEFSSYCGQRKAIKNWLFYTISPILDNWPLWMLYNIISYLVIGLLVVIVVQYVTPCDSRIRFVSCYTVYLLWSTIVTIVISPVIVVNYKNGVINCLYGANLLKYAANILGIEYELRNGHHLRPETGAAVVVANHQSFFDVLGMFTKWHVMRKCTAIARRKIFYIWPFGLLAWIAGVVFIDRIPSYQKTYQKINEAAEYVVREKAKLWMFVEGTRNKNPQKLLPFKKGAFRVAICCQLPIIPLVFSPYYFIDGKTMYFGRGKIIMEALEPISTEGMTLDNLDELINKVYEIMSKKNDELRDTFKKLSKEGKLQHCKNL